MNEEKPFEKKEERERSSFEKDRALGKDKLLKMVEFGNLFTQFIDQLMLPYYQFRPDELKQKLAEKFFVQKTIACHKAFMNTGLNCFYAPKFTNIKYQADIPEPNLP